MTLMMTFDDYKSLKLMSQILLANRLEGGQSPLPLPHLKSGHIGIKDAQCDETHEKNNFNNGRFCTQNS